MRKLTAVAILGLWLASSVFGEEIKMSIKEYYRRSEQAGSPEAYERAFAHLKDIKIGMSTHQFFSAMEMLYLRDKKGKGMDGFCEGHLRTESQERTEGKRPDHYLVFGYYKKWKEHKGPVEKFYVVFRDKRLLRVVFVDKKDDLYGLGRVDQP